MPVLTPTAVARHYDTMQIATATLPKAIVLLHERCISFIIKSGTRIPPLREHLDKAQNILAQLEAALDVDDDISKGLFYLYDYCYLRLETAENQDRADAVDILLSLRNTFARLYRTL